MERMTYDERCVTVAELIAITDAAARVFPHLKGFQHVVGQRAMRLADMVAADEPRENVRQAAINMRAWQTAAPPAACTWWDNQLADLADSLTSAKERAELDTLAERLREDLAHLTF